MTPSHSDFARLNDRVEETIEKKIGRVETKLDEVGRAVRNLALLEERQALNATQVKELQATAVSLTDRFERRAAAMGERFDARVSELVEKHRQLEGKFERFMQRAVGGSMCVAALWAVASHFTHLLKP